MDGIGVRHAASMDNDSRQIGSTVPRLAQLFLSFESMRFSGPISPVKIDNAEALFPAVTIL